MSEIKIGKYKMDGKRLICDSGMVVLGTLIFSIATHAFIMPANIAPGGATGVALMIHFLTELPVGMLSLILNIPLLILAWIYLSRRFTITTAAVSVLSTIILDWVVAPICPVYTGDRLLCSLYGGVLVGVGLAFVFMTGTTTGGTDILGYLLQKKNPHISIGRALLIVDGIILAISIFVFGDIEAALFGMIALYAQTKVMDSIIYGGNVGSMATIVTSKPDAITARIIYELDRTATLIPAKGAYSKKDTSVLLCTVRKTQFSLLKRIVHEEDPNSFVMVTETSEVFGEGFKNFTS